MENIPEAAPMTGTEGTPTTPATEPMTPAGAPAQPEVKTPVADIPADKIEAFNKFISGQGGFENAFNRWKDMVSKPQPQPQQPQAQPQQMQQQMPIEEQARMLQTPAGYVSQQEFMAQQYYNSLANQEQYAPIADKIRSGEMFSEMAKFGIRPMDAQGNINDTQVREFFDLYAKTVPAKPAQSPESAAAPTVDYIPVNDGKISSYQQAAQIIAQSAGLKDRGMAEHPQIQAAKDYVRDYLAGKIK